MIFMHVNNPRTVMFTIPESPYRRGWRPAAIAGVLALLLLAATSVSADDRSLLRDSAGEPYVFIIFDTSGSMHWTPRCPLADFSRPPGDPEKCNQLCAPGDCFAPMQGDDPNSKLYIAKEALYEIIDQVDDMHFGFATYNQDELRVRHKHWLYEVAEHQPTGPDNRGIELVNGERFPCDPISQAAGDCATVAQEVFGYGPGSDEDWDCDNGSGFNDRGCKGSNPSDTNDPVELMRVHRYPKLGRFRTTTTRLYIRSSDGLHYRATYTQGATADLFGNPTFSATIRVDRCNNSSCSDRTYRDQKQIHYELVDEFLAWDFQPNTSESKRGFFSQGEASDSPADGGSSCNGWDSNDDTSADKYPNSSGYNIRFPTLGSDPRGPAFNTGDVIPLDWRAKQRSAIKERLAPNLVGSPSAAPDFSSAGYFADSRTSSNDFLLLKQPNERPILAFGATPLGGSLANFETWFTDFAAVAAVQDPLFNCRAKYVLFLTDGDASGCDPVDACTAATNLRSQLVKTFVVAFGVQGGGNKLGCMATNGGTGEPVFPQNKQQLVESLGQIFNEIRAETKAFSAASVPTVQRETADKIYLSSFTPLPGESFWSGSLQAFRKQIPLTDDNRPDSSKVCSSSVQSSCLLWEAGANLYDQAPTQSQVDAGNYRLSISANERRVFYPRQSLTGEVPGSLRLFEPPTPASGPVITAEEADFWNALDLDPDPLDAPSNRTRATTVVKKVLRQKTASIINLDGMQTEVNYVLGDIFHADPRVLSAPSTVEYYINDVCGSGAVVGIPNNCPAGIDDRGYKDFADRHQFRRRMLAIGANDGQMHFFNAGVRRKVGGTNFVDDGTGKELFSVMPRLSMPALTRQVEDVFDRHVFTVDGSVSTGDVMIDPVHNGSPVAADREWRTVLVGGLRESGFVLGADRLEKVNGYYALDITLPDPTVTDNGVIVPASSNEVPACLLLAGSGQGINASCETLSSEGLPFPAQMWSWSDREVNPGALGNPATGPDFFYLDEEDVNGDGNPDGNGEPDLGDGWSVPVIGQIRICRGPDCDPSGNGGDIRTVFVSIFGGGLDPEHKTDPRRGQFIYMVDIETGRTIYKRQVDGAVPATPAALDIDQNGVLDRVYFGTTEGSVYKIDLQALNSSGQVPGLVSFGIDNSRLDGSPLAVGISIPTERVLDPAWEPLEIFQTGEDTFINAIGDTVSVGRRPIYQAITTLFVPDLSQYALTFGTGDRENLWEQSRFTGRQYLIVDQGFEPLSSGLPRQEDDYEKIAFDASTSGGDFILNPTAASRGWVLQLEKEDRLITQTFALVGVLVFTVFEPQIDVNSADDVDGDGIPDTLCAFSGVSKAFVIAADNADPVANLEALTTSAIEGGRGLKINDFTTSPFVDQTATKNPEDPSQSTLNSALQEQIQREIRESLKRFFPKGCRYSDAYNLTVNASQSNTGLVRYATIPIAMCPVDWVDR